jgi:hypothetical protein
MSAGAMDNITGIIAVLGTLSLLVEMIKTVAPFLSKN